MQVKAKKFLFSPIVRIREQPEFRHTFREGKRLYSPHYILYYRPNKLAHARMGIITSKRNVGNAVSRNRIKRVVRETFRLKLHELIAVDLVLVAQKKASHANKEELKQCIEQMFTTLKLA